MNNLVIVESPTKARTLAKFLGKDYTIEASMGHIRDLPKSDLGIDVEKNFEPAYIIPRDKRKKVNELKKIAQSANQLWLATDPDREGEAIAWHIKELLGNSSKGPKTSDQRPIQRVVFHEITEDAIKEAFAHPRALDLQLVDAQQARRVLDRLVGYKLSPLLWKKVKRGLSAGRVQSVALRLIVERDREIDAFKPIEYWSIEAELETKDQRPKTNFFAQLIQYQGKKLEIKNEKEANDHLAKLKAADYQIDTITKKQVKRSPAPPFTTSTLQQAAGNKLGLSAKKTMSLAQFLYEHGLITYMRTDSFNLSPVALAQTRDYIAKKIGKEYLPSAARVFKTKSKVAQEAHEAIRPTNMSTTTEELKKNEGLTRDHLRLYDLIWKRMLASQMAEALLDQTTVDVAATSHELPVTSYTLRATGSVIKFDGWLRVYGVAQLEEEEKDKEEGTKKQVLPELNEKEPLNLLGIHGDQHFTEPPPRFNEASLIKKLEELGIGRPSTYAPILSTIQDRFYVEKKERKFFTTPLGMAVTDFLLKNFPEIVDYKFTAKMEDDLDEIATGGKAWQPLIKEFYTPFEKKIEQTEQTGERVKIATETIDKNCPRCGKQLIVRFGRFGKFLACSGFPECKHTEAYDQITDVKCPDDGGELVVRRTKKGRPFYGCKNWPTCKFASWTKPKPDKESKPPEETPAAAT